MKKRDEHLLGGDFFDAARYPEITLRVDDVALDATSSDTTAQVTIKGNERAVPLRTSVFARDGQIEIDATGSLNRRDFAIEPPAFLDRVVVGTTIHFALTLVARPI